jgi:hypothetical protein
MEMNMNRYLTALALAAAIAAPTVAQARMWSSDTASPHSSVMTNDRGYGYNAGSYVGHDPDPGIESELLRDPPDDR